MALNFNLFAQGSPAGDPKFNQCYSYALQGDISKALAHIRQFHDFQLSPEQIELKQKFIVRFQDNNEEFTYNTKDNSILELIEIYRSYWNEVLLKKAPSDTAEKKLREKVSYYIYTDYFVNLNEDEKKVHNEFPDYLRVYLKERGCNSATGKTAGIYDLLLWTKDTHSDYDVTLPEGKVTVKVVFMDEVVTMGWEDYATFGKFYPGGWATDKELYCVRSAYDTASENFKISYLQHEAQHFSDYKIFPKLSGPDLEYRAKLVELSYAKETLFHLINFFIKTSKYYRNNPHGFGNFCVVRDLSKKIFGAKEADEIITEIEKWKEVPVEKINTAAKELLAQNTAALKKEGRETVSEFMK